MMLTREGVTELDRVAKLEDVGMYHGGGLESAPGERMGLQHLTQHLPVNLSPETPTFQGHPKSRGHFITYKARVQ